MVVASIWLLNARWWKNVIVVRAPSRPSITRSVPMNVTTVRDRSLAGFNPDQPAFAALASRAKERHQAAARAFDDAGGLSVLRPGE
jgi:hypothetical protein